MSEAAATPIEIDSVGIARRWRRLRFTAGAALVGCLLVGALVATFTILNSKITSLNQQLAATKVALAKTNTAVEQTSRNQVTTLSSKLDDANARLALYETGAKKQATQLSLLGECLPELENQVGSVGVETSNTNGWLTSAYVSNNAQISKHCQTLIYGKNSSDGGP